ncbi:ATP-dependent helicase HrpB [Schaalia sp. Marseille-Q2122]|uniref:ATP-dependent helicase HrpB n=1 Tax=Schaalia sp. Marseille-Q2122 TaxID=2736604 RepID=UPI0020CA2D71|nr:ATP-dependent helicase HrpB [Schaalia sp. Marseille-Q2122]
MNDPFAALCAPFLGAEATAVAKPPGNTARPEVAALPVAAALHEIAPLCIPGGALVVTAEPGSGKTTLLPPLFACLLAANATGSATSSNAHSGTASGTASGTTTGAPCRILVTQPRRIAARAAARRLAHLIGEKVGQSVGYSVRGDSALSATTRIEFLTPGLLLRRLHADPELPGVAGILFDEFHERHLDSDLACAFSVDVRATVREDLFLAVTSATLDVERTLALLAEWVGETRHVDVPVPLYPLEERWAPPPRGVSTMTTTARGELVVARDFLQHIASTTVRAFDDGRGRTDAGDVLVFVPGVREIHEVSAPLATALASSIAAGEVEILSVHGGLSPAEQDRALTPREQGRRRIIIATAVAESSLTIPGVRTVVDAGLSREPRVEPVTGVGSLVTVPVSRGRGAQRAGRAARLGPGVVVRCADAVEWAKRPAHSQPEIVCADITDALLQAKAWGAASWEDLALLDRPSDGTTAAATQRLQALGACDADGRVTDHGRRLVAYPVEPAWANACEHGRVLIGVERTARAVAILSEELRPEGADLSSAARALLADRGRGASSSGRRGGAQGRSASAVADSERRLAAMMRRQGSIAPAPAAQSGTDAAPQGRVEGGQGKALDADLALLGAYAWPGWIARKRPGSQHYLLACGLGAGLPGASGASAPAHSATTVSSSAASPLEGCEWLVVTDLARAPGSRDALIRAAIPADEALARQAASALLRREVLTQWDNGRLRARERELLGAIELRQRPLPECPPEAARDAIAQSFAREGVSFLEWSAAARQLRARMAALHEVLGEPWPDVSDEALANSYEEWLGAECDRLAAGAPLASVDCEAALRNLLPWPEAARLEELAPVRLPIPAGGTREVEWSTGQPTLSLRVQQAFGWTATPTWADGRGEILIHLLDPAGRPVAVTSDLASFWVGPYQQVRAQLRGRYPKHPWPEDPFSEAPTSRAKPRQT